VWRKRGLMERGAQEEIFAKESSRVSPGDDSRRKTELTTLAKGLMKFHEKGGRAGRQVPERISNSRRRATYPRRAGFPKRLVRERPR